MEPEKLKTVWITSGELQMMYESVRQIEHYCPYCLVDRTYPLSNGEVLDITMSSLVLECFKCGKKYHISWEGDPNFMKDEEDFLPF